MNERDPKDIPLIFQKTPSEALREELMRIKDARERGRDISNEKTSQKKKQNRHKKSTP